MVRHRGIGVTRGAHTRLGGGDSAGGNAFQSYIASASVQEEETTIAPLETDGAKAISVAFVPALFVFIAGIFV